MRPVVAGVMAAVVAWVRAAPSLSTRRTGRYTMATSADVPSQRDSAAAQPALQGVVVALVVSAALWKAAVAVMLGMGVVIRAAAAVLVATVEATSVAVEAQFSGQRAESVVLLQ